MTYEQFGIRKPLVDLVKERLKNRAKKDKIKALTKHVTRRDLQNEAKVRKLLEEALAILGITVSKEDKQHLIHFILAQKIDPNNTFQLIKLWSMFR